MIFCLNNCNFFNDEDELPSYGTCNFETGECECEENFGGTDCSIYIIGITNGINKQFIYVFFGILMSMYYILI